MSFAPMIAAVFLFGSMESIHWADQSSGTGARLRGLAAVSAEVAWASGSQGTILRTTDGGRTWVRRLVPGAEGLDFRDIEAFDEGTAVALSVGPGDRSRIYRTEDGGESWTIRHNNPDADGFLDALAFWDRNHGLALGDPVGDRFVVLTTEDGGSTWRRIEGEGMPPALPHEGAFAASGTCLSVRGERLAWFGTGAGRVFRSDDWGRTWKAHPTPIAAGNGSSGIFSLVFWDPEHGVAVGGDFKQPSKAGAVAALTSDGGKTWRLPGGPQPEGYRSAIALVSGPPGPRLLAVGPGGTSLSADAGASWAETSQRGFHAVAASGRFTGWAVGENGSVARFEIESASRHP
jgi:photosystem II stability/assembly factor-like uncharacterized protein